MINKTRTRTTEEAIPQLFPKREIITTTVATIITGTVVGEAKPSVQPEIISICE